MLWTPQTSLLTLNFSQLPAWLGKGEGGEEGEEEEQDHHQPRRHSLSKLNNLSWDLTASSGECQVANYILIDQYSFEKFVFMPLQCIVGLQHN